MNANAKAARDVKTVAYLIVMASGITLMFGLFGKNLFWPPQNTNHLFSLILTVLTLPLCTIQLLILVNIEKYDNQWRRIALYFYSISIPIHLLCIFIFFLFITEIESQAIWPSFVSMLIVPIEIRIVKTLLREDVRILFETSNQHEGVAYATANGDD